MKKLRANFERFCYRHHNLGIPNLMLYVVLGSAVVFVLSLMDQSQTLYQILRFDRSLILQGQVWRLFTYVFTYTTPDASRMLMTVISLYCFYSLGRTIERIWGTFRFNLYYFSGILLMDVFAMCLGGIPATIAETGEKILVPGFVDGLYADMALYLNLGLLISFATLYPDAQFLFLYILPVKAWIFGLVYLGMIFYFIYYWTFTFGLFVNLNLFPHNLFPLVGLANYFLFFGKDVLNLIPQGCRNWFRRLFRRKPKAKPAAKQEPIQFRTVQRSAPKREDFNHRCYVCGRTDTSNPELEFRYCSRCQGYHCYCQDHINNHEHV